jgi:1,2-diacylglycerol 3-alpha-glucosyltransferase
MIHTYHTMYEDYTHYIARGHIIKPRTAGDFSRIFCNRAKHVIAPTAKTMQSLLGYGVKRPISIVPTGIDFAPFRRDASAQEETLEVRRTLGINADDPVIVFIGRIAKEKRIDVILRQFAEVVRHIPDAKFVVVGDGPAMTELKDMTASLRLNNAVIFTGARPWSEIGKYYRMSDAFVSASTSETQGLTYIEAMAAEVPVIAKADSSLDNVITDGVNGFLFENDGDLGACIISALSDRPRLKEISTRACAGIEEFSSGRFSESVADIYAKAIEANHGRRRDVVVMDALSKILRYPKKIGKIVRYPHKLVHTVLRNRYKR